jgi:thioredoxin 1
MTKDYPKTPVVITDSDFDTVVKKYPVVIVDCWAVWCMPCRMLEPIVESLAKKYTGKIVFGKLNVDKNKKIAMKYSIMSIPTLLVFKNGKNIDRIIGAMPEPVLESRIKQYL